MIKIFTDGASRGNPGPGGWGAIISNGETVEEIGGRDKYTTNNRMELTAVIKALEYLRFKLHAPSASVFTDSSYVLNGASKWIYGWQKNEWKTKSKDPVENKELWIRFLKASTGLRLEWQLLPGHSGIPANDRCDAIATAFADGKKPILYSGPVKKYEINIKTVSPGKAKLSSGKSKRKISPYSYISMVDGKIKIHKSWADCEKRVKGVKKAKFKKSISLEDEQMIIHKWQSES